MSVSAPRPSRPALDPVAARFAAAGLVWAVVGVGLTPLLRHLLAGRLVGPLNAAMDASPEVDAAYIVAEWHGFVVAGTGACLVLAGLAAVLRSPSLSARLVGEARPGEIGAIRALVCGVLLVSALWEDVSSTAALPRDFVRPMGVLGVLNGLPIGFAQFAASGAALLALKAVTVGALSLGMVGWRTRLVLPLAAVGYLILSGLMRQYAWFYHTGLIPLYLLGVLCVLPAGDGFSIDRLRRRWRGEPVPPARRATRRYGWARYALWATLALPYVAAGLSKLRNAGLDWVTAENFRYILYYSTLRPMEFDFDWALYLTTAPDGLLTAMAAGAILSELAYGLVLFSKTARRVVPAVTVGLHLGILVLQNILFFDLILLQLVFYQARPLRLRLARRLAQRRGRLRLAYDPADAAHARAVRLVTELDAFDRVALVPQRGAAWSVAQGASESAGGASLPRLARALPALWPLVPALTLRPVREAVARRLLGAAPAEPAPAAVRLRLAGPRLVLTIATVLAVCWTFRVEFYPLTGMQMFSKVRGTPVVYEWPVAHLASGERVRAPIEASLGAMRDGRARRILAGAFTPDGETRAARFFDIVADRWNAHAAPEARIVRVEVQQWRWDFVADRDNPQYGTLQDRRVFEVGGGRLAPAAHP